ncbi:MAG: Ig-like domain-containing protein [Actinobacteria bacterium]|nr:Ig-like domain-containing protein [Actinomycetota bacterium]
MLGFDWKKGLSRLVGASLAVVMLTVVGTVSPAHAYSADFPYNSSSPVDNAIGIAVGANIQLLFLSPVAAQANKMLMIGKTSDNSIVETIPVNGGLVTGSGTTTITINPTSDLLPSTEYYILLAAGAFTADGFASLPVTDPTVLSFTTAGGGGPAPTVGAVTPIALMQGSYGVGATIPIAVCFSDTATVSNGGANANIKLVLNTNATGINYTGSLASLGGPSNNCLVFNYVVASGDTPQMTIEATAITLANSATITVGGSPMNAPSTSLTGKLLTGFGVDKDPPTLLSSLPADAAETVAVDANLALTFNSLISQYISVTSKACSSNVVTLSTAAAHGLDVGDRIAVLQVDPGMDSIGTATFLLASGTTGSTLVYAKTCTTSVASASGGAVAPSRVISIGADADTNKTVTNVVLASNVATLTSASHGFVVGDTVVVDAVAVGGVANREFNGAYVITAIDTNTFSYAVIGSDVSTVSATGGTARRVVEAVSLPDARVTVAGSTLTFNPTATLAGNTAYHVRVQSGAIRDTSGNTYAGLLDATTLNLTTAVGAPRVNNITSSTANGGYKSTSAISIQVRFSEPVSVVGTPRLSLNSDAAAVASYASGSGTNTLTFTYTVGSADTTALAPSKLLNINGIGLNGGTIVATTGGAPAQLSPVPASFAAGALNTNKAIVIDNAAPLATGLMPFPGAVGVQATQQLIIRTNEPVLKVDNKLIYIKTAVPHVAKSSTIGERTGNTVTLTTSAVHGLVAGNTVVVAGVAESAFNGTFVVVSAPTTTTITYVTGTSGNITSAAAVGTVTRTIWETITIGVNSNAAVTNDQKGGTLVITRTEKASTVSLVTDPATVYYVETEAGALTDLAGNPLAAISGSGFWAFTASPDTTAPNHAFNRSDPPNGMTNFDITRNIQIQFNEAVSAVSAKTIRLCTGAADCATPVETFTIPSSAVTSTSAGMAQSINPTSNLNFSTTYFLLIDAGTFEDGAGNPTAAAVTAGQYSFRTSAQPSGPAPSGPAPSGPAPFNPIGGPAPFNPNLGPQPFNPNQGPAFVFQPGNSMPPAQFGSMTPNQLAGINPNRFANFNPNQMGAIPPSAMANMNPNQFAAIRPDAMAGFNPSQIGALPPSAMANMNQSQMRALPPDAMSGFKPDQMAALPPQAFSGMKSNQMGQMPPSAMAGMNQQQMQQLPPNAFGGFNPNQIDAMPPAAFSGMKPTQMGQMPPNAFGGFSPQQINAMPPNAFSGMKPNQMGQMPPSAMASMSQQQMRQMPPNAFAGFNPNQIDAMPPAAFSGMKPTQMKQMPPNAFSGFSPQQVSAMPPNAFSGMKSNQMGQMPPNAFSGFSPQQMDALPPTAMAGMQPNQFAALPPNAMSAMSSTQMRQLPPNAMLGMQQGQFAALPPSAMNGFKPDQFAALPPSAMAGMQPNQFAALPSSAFGSMSAKQMNVIPNNALAAITPNQFRSLTPEVLASMSPEQRNALPQQALNPVQLNAPTNGTNNSALVGALNGWNMNQVPANTFNNFKPTDVGRLSSDAFSALSPQQFQAMPPTAFAGFKPDQVGALPPEVFAGMKPNQMGQMPPAAFGSFNAQQVGAMPPAVFAAMKPNQMGQMPPEAFEAMNASQIGAMPPTAFAGFKPDQVGAMPPEAFATMKPNQMNAMPPAAFAALSADQIGAMPPKAFAAMKPTQMRQMPPAAFEAMKPTQLGAMPPTAFASFKADQVDAMPPEAFAGMKTGQVAAMSATAIGSLSGAQVGAMPPTAFAAMKPAQLRALPPDALAVMVPTQVGALPAAAFTAIKADQIDALPPEAFGAMKSTQVGSLPPAAFGSLSSDQIGSMRVNAFTAIKPAQMGALEPEALVDLSKQKVGAMPAAAFKSIKADQVDALPAEAFAGMKPAQMSALTPTALGAMSPEQLTELRVQAMGALKRNQVAALPPDAFEAMKPTQAAALLPAAVGALKPDQVGQLDAATFGALKPAQLAAFKPGVADGVTVEQLEKLTPRQVKSLPKAFVANLDPEQRAAINP